MKNSSPFHALCLKAIPLMAAANLTLPAMAQSESKDSLRTPSKEENGRNVMLNAASANGPREISIGLPGGDVNVLENGLPGYRAYKEKVKYRMIPLVW